MSQDFDLFCCMLSLTKPAVAELLDLIGVGGCGCPRDSKACRIGRAICAFMSVPAVSASAAEEKTCRRVLHVTKIGAFRGGGTVLGSLER